MSEGAQFAPPPPPGAPPARAPLGRAASAWFWALIGWTALLSFYHLDGGARFEPIDCWVAQTAREMLDADNWLVPRFSGETRMQKSPGPYWMVMLVSLLRGQPVDEISARIPNGVAAVVLVATIYWLTRRIAGERAAVFAGFAAASSTLLLWWSHRGASDLGLATCTTVSLAALWIAAEAEPPGRTRSAYFLLGYFAAGVGMLWKMPMPLVVVGLPTLVYVVAGRRWAVLKNPWHLVGLLVFLLPWLPWALAVSQAETVAVSKWKVEFLDRFTGNLPNVAGQNKWPFLFFYLIPGAVYCIPFTLSLPMAIVRGFQRRPGIARAGTLFLLAWFGSLLVFFTASVGKELRYFLPALPPLFVLLGIELADFFDPHRAGRPTLRRIGAAATWIGVPAGFVAGGGWGLYYWWRMRGASELDGLYDWSDVWRGYAVLAVIASVGFGLAAWFFLRKRGNLSFGAIVATMWLAWLWTWPHLGPLLMSQRPFTDFAHQLADSARVPPGLRAHMRHVGTQDSRIIWYSDVRIPRLIDQLALLKEQAGRRQLDYELRRYGEEMVARLAGDSPILLVASLPDYLMFLKYAPAELASADRTMPPIHLWLQARYGRADTQFVLIGNRPPPFPEPELRLSDDLRQKLLQFSPPRASAVKREAPPAPAIRP